MRIWKRKLMKAWKLPRLKFSLIYTVITIIYLSQKFKKSNASIRDNFNKNVSEIAFLLLVLSYKVISPIT